MKRLISLGILFTTFSAYATVSYSTANGGGGSAVQITNTPSGNLVATTVQAALDELQTSIDGISSYSLPTQTGNSGKFLTTNGSAESWGVPPASGVSNAPTGALVATTVQAAVDELQADISTLSSLPSQWFFQGNIASSGSDNVDLSTSDQASYVAGDVGSLVLEMMPGSATGQIACAGTTAPSGTTCSAANEQVGVQVTVPYTGYYEVCVTFAHYRVVDTSDYILAGFGIMRTAANSQTILEDGGNRQQSTSVTPATLNETMPIHLCGSFGSLTANTAYTFRLMYEHDVNNTPTANAIVTNPSATWGQPGATIMIRRK